MKLKKMVFRLAIACGLTQALIGCSQASGKELKVLPQKTIELGDEVSLNPADYLIEVPSDEVLEEIKVESPLKSDSNLYTYNDFSKTVSSKGKDYLMVGTYPITFSYKGEKYSVNVVVEDTVMPEFVSPPAVVTIPLGTTSFDFSETYKTKDKDEVKLDIEGEYNLEKVGVYPVTLIAKDGSGNSNSLEISINVLGNNRQIKASDQFEYEYVPPVESITSWNDSTQNASSTQENLSSQDKPGDTNDQVGLPNVSQKPSSTAPTACTISRLPQNAQAFYSFSELYAVGTSWNKLSPNHYFFYIEASDDCGNKVYALTKGDSSEGENNNPAPITPVDPIDPDDSTNDTNHGDDGSSGDNTVPSNPIPITPNPVDPIPSPGPTPDLEPLNLDEDPNDLQDTTQDSQKPLEDDSSSTTLTSSLSSTTPSVSSQEENLDIPSQD